MNDQASSADPRPGTASRVPGLFIPAAILLVAVLVRLTALENHDVAWYLLAAGRMLHGGSYARDFFEVNMPLAIALYIPPAAIAAMMSLPTVMVADGLMLVLAAQSAALCVQFVGKQRGWSLTPLARGLLASWLLLVLCFEPGYDFAQREHFIAVLVLPFLFMLTAPDEGIGIGLRAYVSLLAGIGFMIKPHYWPLPWLLLGLRAWRVRSWRPLRGPEARLLAGVALLVIAGTLIMYPDWLACLRWATDLYPSFSQDAWARTLALRGVGLMGACIVFQCLLAWVDADVAGTIMPFVVTAAYAFGAAVLQAKGWQYHFLPAIIFAFSGQVLALMLTARRLKSGRSSLSLFRGLIAVSFVAGAAATAISAVRNTPAFGSLGLVPQALRTVATEGDPVYAFTVEVPPMLPTVPLLKLQWASRYSSLWPLPALLKAERMSSSADAARLLATYRKPFIQSVCDDFTRYRPRVVFVDRHRLPGMPAGYDLMSFFLADPGFARIWADYARIGSVTYPGTVTGYDIYFRAADEPAVSAQSSGS